VKRPQGAISPAVTRSGHAPRSRIFATHPSPPALLWAGLLVCAAIGLAAPAAAQEPQSLDQRISVELNAVKSTDAACTLTFMIINGFEMQIYKLVYETVLFDTDGQVDRLTLFDFGALPSARPRVRQFAVQGTTCEGLGMILINGASTCSGTDLPRGACEAGLITGSRTAIEVQG